ncbi:MAG: hypothetical protein ACHQ0J_15925 [Candidatus Dormibacterales bacterium]
MPVRKGPAGGRLAKDSPEGILWEGLEGMEAGLWERFEEQQKLLREALARLERIEQILVRRS